MIRLAEKADLNEIARVYNTARQFMQENGNATQWTDGYPKNELVLDDICRQQLYIYEETGRIHGVFMFQEGEDPTYAEIEGTWINEEPYSVIHRIASDGETKGVFETCINYAKERCVNLRIDTHEDNKIMQHLIKKNGFQYCGVIYVEDGSPRVAFHYKK